MKRSVSLLSSLVLLGAALPHELSAAFTAGGTAFTKRIETVLLSEPKALAAPAGRVGYARKLKVEEVRGVWLRVSEGSTSGWVFSGNVAEEPSAGPKGLEGVPLAASETSAAAAARPLAPAAVDYSSRRGLATARTDVEWLEHTSDAVTPQQIDAYLKAQKKGEFQP